uniref:Insulin-like peptide 1 n=1 Tax=Chrysopa pallens TaxID=417485 RepID=A0A482PFM1_CHRPA|nr:insulin-like peptide 1 [Chrysopa pallens]
MNTMSNCYWFIFVWFFNIILNVNCYATYPNGRYTVNYPSGSDSPQKLCGAALTNTLMAVCQGFTNGRDKKFNSLLDHIMEYDNQDEDETGIILPNQEQQHLYMPNLLNSLVDNGRVKRTGIVEECCHNPCSKRHLRAYCLNRGNY